MAAPAETYVFQAEINQLMSLIVNAFYSNKDVFLRELISNANDALDKMRHHALTAGHAGAIESVDLRVRIVADKAARTLTIEDSGIGMTKQELLENLGTIARSGTKQFMDALAKTAGGDNSTNLIGQFGVGFYSAFLVADRVSVISRGEAPGAHMWSSDAGGSFTIAPAERAERGSTVILYLKEDQSDLLEESRIRSLVQTHSAYITYAIELLVERTKEIEDPDAEEEVVIDKEAEATQEDEEGKIEDATPKEKPKKTIKVTEWETLNAQKPIWTRKPDDVTPAEYQAFYKSFSHDYQDAIAYKHFAVEGQLEFRGILYLPSQAPHDLHQTTYTRRNLRLHVRRVFITDKCDDVVPEYLGFVKGVIDSDDLPLNVSRETFQHSRVFNVMKKNITKKCIELMTELADDADTTKFPKFFEAFSKNIKLGIYEDEVHRTKLAGLVRCASSFSAAPNSVSFKDYVARAKEDQKHIFYITGENMAQVAGSPFLAPVRAKGYDVLFFTDTMDEYMMQRLTEFDGKKFVNIAKDSKELSEALGTDASEIEADPELCTFLHEAIGKDTVSEVRITKRALDTPAVLLPAEYGMSANMERIMRAQTLQNNQMMLDYMKGRRVLEILPTHPLMKTLRVRMADPIMKEWAVLIYECAAMQSGFTLENTGTFVKRMFRMMAVGMGAPEVEGETETEPEPEPEAEPTAVETRMEDLD